MGIGRRTFFGQAVVAVAAGALPLAVRAQQATRLTFLHTNDNYEIVPTLGWGGFAQLMTLIKQERAASPNALVTFGGDLLSPSIMSGFHKGAQMIELMNAVGTDLAVLGNHEFDFGPDVLAQRLRELRFQWLATNVIRDGKPLADTADYVVRAIGGLKVGFFGIVTPDTVRDSSPGPSVAFEGHKETAQKAVRTLRDRGAEVIVALTHLDFAEDREIARTVPGIAVILGGHDHDALTFLEGDTLILKSGADARYLGVVDLLASKRPSSSGPATVEITHAWRMIPVRGVPADPHIAAIVKRYTDELDAELAVQIATVDKPLDSRRLVVREAEAAIGNLIADAIRDAVGADVALMNGGGIRGDRVYQPGTIFTRRDAMTELPFGNTTVLIELKGSDLLEALENGVSRVEDRAGRFPQVSGIRFAYDPGRPRMHRVVAASVNGAPLDLGRTYRVATIDFLLAGGDGYASLAKGRVLLDASGALLTAAQVMSYIANHRRIDAVVDGRITVQR